jgi:fructose-1,6-bisphosphatase/inositol monophosphatase family enzyme
VFMAIATQLTAEDLLAALRKVHVRIRSAVVAACQSSTFEELCGEAKSASGDTVYAIDRIAEHAMLNAFNELIASQVPIVLVGEGVDNGAVTLPAGTKEADAKWRIIVDPIDGTRGLMFQKRSAWILMGAAANHSIATTTSDIKVAVQTEIPLVKQHLCDSFSAISGQGMHAERENRLTGEVVPLRTQPSSATTLAHGYGTVCSFFAGGRDLLGKIADELSRTLLSGNLPGEARIFDDQYASTGGQLAGLITGQDRFVADVRPMLLNVLSQRGDVLGHCCHPYDICTKLIAEEAGVEIRLPNGQLLDVPLDTETNVTWIGYANKALRMQIEPVLQGILIELALKQPQ